MSVGQGRLAVGHLVSGRYQVAALIGSGEMGEVYDVRDTSSGYAYALKLLRPEVSQNAQALQALERDARKAAELGLDVLAKAYEFGIEAQTQSAFILGEMVLLPSLAQMVSTQGPISISSLEVILRTLAAGLDKAHQAGVVHRALKPTNLFASQTDAAAWQVRATDCGIASARLLAPPPPGWTATPGWLSAEQADPSSASAATMDVYALGLIAFFALTGRSPFRSMQTAVPDLNMLWAEMTAPLPSASTRARDVGTTLSPTLDPWFSRALSVSPGQRFKTVGEMAQALWGLVGSSQHIVTMRPPPGVPAAPAPAPIPAPPPVPQGTSSQLKGRQQTLMYGEAGMPPPPPLPAPPVGSVPRPGQSQPQQPPGRQPAQGVSAPYTPGRPPELDDDDEMPTRAMTREQFELDSVAEAAAVAPGLPPMPVMSAQPTMPSGGAPGQLPTLQGGMGMASGPMAMTTAPAKRKSGLLIPLAAGGGVLVLGLIVILVVAVVRRGGETESKPSESAAASSPAPSASAPASATASEAPDATAPVAKDAQLKITCEPGCDDIKCDGKSIGTTDKPVRMDPGRHSCTGTKKGYVARTETIELKAGDEVSKTFSLDKIATGGGAATAEAKPPATATVKPPATAKPPATGGGKKPCGTFLNPCK